MLISAIKITSRRICPDEDYCRPSLVLDPYKTAGGVIAIRELGDSWPRRSRVEKLYGTLRDYRFIPLKNLEIVALHWGILLPTRV
jgi:hypothetical protein